MGSEAGSYLRLIDSCITQLKVQGPSRTCNESNEKEEEGSCNTFSADIPLQKGIYLDADCLRERQRGTSLMRNTHPPRITIGPSASGYCRVLRGGMFLMSKLPL